MKRKLVLLTLFSAVLLALALPNEIFPYGQPLIGVICLAPLFIALSEAASFGQASLLGVIFGVSSTLLTNYWLIFFQQFSAWTLGGVVLGYAGYNALLAPFLNGLARMSGRYRPFILAAAWALYEYLKSIGFLGFPWGLVAYPVNEVLPLIQFVAITGIWGLSFLMALINSVIAEMFIRLDLDGPDLGRERERSFPIAMPRTLAWRGQALLAVSLIAMVLVYGFYRLQIPIPWEKELRVLLVQQNTDPWDTGGVLENIRTNQNLSTQGLQGKRRNPDLVVWSESSIRYPVVENERFFERNPPDRPLLPFIRQANTWFLTGAPVVTDWEKNTAMNSVLLFNPEGEVEAWYGKQHPVPFAESIPFWEYAPVRRFFQEVIGLDSDWEMGREYTTFELPLRSGRMLRFGAPICFEDAFSDLCRRFILQGADLWINLTNDYWSRTVSSETQHFVAARFRAVENRRVLIRSTNGGVTAIVGPRGEIIGRLPLFQPGYLSARVPVYREEQYTPYTRYGDYFPLILAGLLMGLLIGNAARIYLGRKECRRSLRTSPEESSLARGR